MKRRTLFLYRRTRSLLGEQRGIETIEWIASAAVVLVLLLGMFDVLTTAGDRIGGTIWYKMDEWVERWNTGGSGSPGYAGAAPTGSYPSVSSSSVSGPPIGIGAPGTLGELTSSDPKEPYKYQDSSGRWTMYLDPETGEYVIEGRSETRTVSDAHERTVTEYPGWTDWFPFA